MRNPTYEQALTLEGFQWHYEESVLLEDIDAAKGLRNQARLENPLDPDLADKYGRACKEGQQFPPLVLWRPGRGKFVPLDGNHRIAGLQKYHFKETDAYVIDVTDQQLADRLAWTFNNKVNGRRNTTEESLQHAITFVRKYGWTARNAAREWGVSENAVGRLCRVEAVKDTLAGHKVKITPALTDNVLDRVSSLQPLGEDIMAATATVLGNCGASQDMAHELVSKVRRAKDHEAKLKAIDDFAKDEYTRQKAAETRGGRIKHPTPLPRQQLVDLLDKLTGLRNKYPDLATFKLPVAEHKEVRSQAHETQRWLAALFGPPAQGEVG